MSLMTDQRLTTSPCQTHGVMCVGGDGGWEGGRGTMTLLTGNGGLQMTLLTGNGGATNDTVDR